MRIARRGVRVVQVGHIIDSISITPRTIQSNAIDWLAAPPGVVQVGPNTDTGELAPELVANGNVDISRYISHELDGLESFERMVDITLNKPKHGALGPAQIAVKRD
jgi:threonine dehydrogenase-like Zn-dependent dehydrogenase